MSTAHVTQSTIISDQIDYYEVGRRFEKYMINLFNKQFFKLKDWNKSEKLIGHNLPGNHSNPDFTLMLFGSPKYKFAVECKWRSRFEYGKIHWAEEHQIRHYQRFKIEQNIPVFVAIGIGGTSSNPKDLFITPLEYLEKSTEAFKHNLLKYKRRPRHRFCYDAKQLELYQITTE